MVKDLVMLVNCTIQKVHAKSNVQHKLKLTAKIVHLSFVELVKIVGQGRANVIEHIPVLDAYQKVYKNPAMKRKGLRGMHCIKTNRSRKSQISHRDDNKLRNQSKFQCVHVIIAGIGRTNVQNRNHALLASFMAVPIHVLLNWISIQSKPKVYVKR